MSLVQHVSNLEGTDREEPLIDLFLPPVERAASIDRRLSLESCGLEHAKSVRRIASYDYLKAPEETIEEYDGGITPYKVPTSTRVGRLARPRDIKHSADHQP